MTAYELSYICLEQFLPVIYRIVRKRLIKIAKSSCYIPKFLDIGGRKSPYTIGVPAKITITDLPKKTEIQRRLHHGLNQEIIETIHKRRSNVINILYDDITQTALPESFFDCVIAVEVLEHVKDDYLFIQQVHCVLQPNGIFLMTTPNGDHPSRKIPGQSVYRYYTKVKLESLLSSFFDNIEVEYAVPVGKFFSLGLKSWSIHDPKQTALSMLGNFINGFQAARKKVKYQAIGTRQLIAVARKHLLDRTSGDFL